MQEIDSATQVLPRQHQIAFEQTGAIPNDFLREQASHHAKIEAAIAATRQQKNPYPSL
jgi:hypothetical protein